MNGPLTGRRIGLLTASASRLGGGVFEAVVVHAEMLARLGASPIVFTLRDRHTEDDRSRFGAVPVVACHVTGPAQIGFAPALVRQLVAAELDCLHLHGIWMYPSLAGARWGKLTGRPYLISPHGMLAPWITARGRLKKAAARVAYERRSWRRARAFHALTPAEAAEIRVEHGSARVVVVPNAGPTAGPAALARPQPIVAYIGRIHPKKNLVELVRGWHLAARPTGARLVIAGWGEPEHVAQLTSALAGGDGSAEFIGPIYGAAKAELLESASHVILPSLSEGLPMAMLEAWSSARPTIMTDACNLAEGFAAGAALRCAPDARAIAASLEQAFAATDGEWLAMANAARSLAVTSFSPEKVSEAWAGIYAAAIAGEQP